MMDHSLDNRLNLQEIIFERMPMGIAIIDQQYRVQRYNPTWGEFAENYSPPSAAPLKPGVNYFELFPGVEELVIPMFEKVLAGETLRLDGMRFETGEVVSYWDLVLAPLDEKGEVSGILNVTADATERVLLQQNLERRVEERTQELERRSEIAESLRDIIGMINSKLPLDEFLERAVELAAQRLGAEGCILHRFDLQKQVITHLASYGMEGIYTKGRQTNFNSLQPSGADSYLAATLAQQPTYTNYEPLSSWIPEFEKDATIPEAVKISRIALRKRFAGSFSVPLFIQDQVYGGMVFYYTQPQDFSDEQIQLGMTFAEQVAVAIENARLHQSELDQQSELQILLDMSAMANSSLNLDEMLSNTLGLLVAKVGASRAGVSLLNEESGELSPRMLRPDRQVDPAEMAKMMQAGKLVIESGKTLYLAPDPSLGLHEPGVLLPLQIRGRKLGMLGIIGQSGGEFNPSQLSLFKSIAEQLGVAIENAHLFEQAKDTAIAAERNRLARDLHDAVTQTLFSASMIADVLPKIWERNAQEGRKRLEELRQLTRGALSEMRTLLVELRPAALEDINLADLIGHQVTAFIARTRIPVEYKHNCIDNPPTTVKETFYRITQEAFNNIAKHADASAVTVQLECSTGSALLRIEDDGLGFDPDALENEGLGLGIMVERARTVGGILEIESQVRGGTRLRLTWYEKNKENHDN